MKQKLADDLKVAMKAREKLKITTLRGVMAAIKQIEVDKRIEVSDKDILGIIQKEIKKRREAIKFAEQGGREDMIQENNNEIDILQLYLGEQLGEEELRQIIASLVEGGAGNIGQIMGALKKEHDGAYEGSVASRIARELLA